MVQYAVQVLQIVFREVLPYAFLCIARLWVSCSSESCIYCFCFLRQARDCCESNWQLRVEVHEALMRGCSFRNDSPVDVALRVKTGSLTQWSGSWQETKKGSATFIRRPTRVSFVPMNTFQNNWVPRGVLIDINYQDAAIKNFHL